MNFLNKALAKVFPAATTVKANTFVRVKDEVDLRNQGVILFNDETMQKIYQSSGHLAKIGNEYQVHYFFLNLRFKAKDNSILDIAIPTVFFNTEQFVTTVHIDFELQDVKDMNEQLEPIHNLKVTELMDSGIVQRLEDFLGVSLEAMSEHSSTVHRHPGSSARQSFSGTDLGKNPNDLGVVYPLHSGEETPNFAGIMAIDNGHCNLAHFEYRLANGELLKDITYTEGRCIAITKDVIVPLSAIEVMTGVQQRNSYKIKGKNCEFNPLFKGIADVYFELDFKPFLETIDPDNVKKKQAVSTTSHFKGKTQAQSVSHLTSGPKKGTSEYDIKKLENLNTRLKEYESAYEQKSIADIDVMNQNQLYLLAKSLNELYYEDVINGASHIEEDDDALELKEEIDQIQTMIDNEILELKVKIVALEASMSNVPEKPKDTTPSQQEMKKVLEGLGISKKDLSAATDMDIIRWYNTSLKG